MTNDMSIRSKMMTTEKCMSNYDQHRCKYYRKKQIMNVAKMLIMTLALYVLLIGAAMQCSKDSPTEPQPEPEKQDIIDTLAYDMSGQHEALPHGVNPDAGWYDHPRVGMGEDPGGFKALTAWGQLYVPESGNPATNTRVQIKDMQTYLMSRIDSTWHLVQDTDDISGAAYAESFAENANKPADARQEPTGGISVTAGNGYNYHYWPASGRIPINPYNVGGVITLCRARLILDDSSEVDDREQARYILSMGADYWLNLSAQWDQWKTNGDVGIGKFKFVENDWKVFSMSTLKENELRKNPPPIDYTD
jgi:hypothetical protein